MYEFQVHINFGLNCIGSTH